MTDSNEEVTAEDLGITFSEGGVIDPEAFVKTAVGSDNMAPEDQAANDYQMGLPVLKSLLNSAHLSKKGVKRVIDALVRVPLELDEPKFQHTVEDALFQTASHMLDCRMIMLSYVLEEKLKQQIEENSEEENGKEEMA